MNDSTLKRLRALGSNKDEVANNLQRMRIKGYRMIVWECPIAVYLQRTANPIRQLLAAMTFNLIPISGKSYYEYCCLRADDRKRLGLEAVYDFQNAFDRGCYPDLMFEQRNHPPLPE